jgi:hypothetical protein
MQSITAGRQRKPEAGEQVQCRQCIPSHRSESSSIRPTSCLEFLLLVWLLAACTPPPASTTAVTPASTVPVQGYPPLPATEARPPGYPAATMVPTFDATWAAATGQAIIAAATATTAAIQQTYVAQGTPLPPSPGGPEPTLAPLPTRLMVDTRPDCEAVENEILCHDALLGMTFTYPAAWGHLAAQYFTGETGSGYDYVFSAATAQVVAGGRSRDFREGRGMILTDFRGWDTGPGERPEDFLAYGAIISNVLQADLVLVTLFPAAKYVCDPEPGVIFSPVGILEINLPANDTLNGFLFATPILSIQVESELAGILGVGDQSKDTKCLDSGLREQFDAKVKAIVDAINSGTIDSGTRENINQLLRLAQSIRFD